MKVPREYSNLLYESGPRILVEALKLYGTTEMPGPGNNQVIMWWAKDLDVDATFTQDAIPWCGLFMGKACQAAGLKPVSKVLWAKAWAAWGNPSPRPMLGDVLVFSRPGGGGHVGLYVGEDSSHFHVLGGNQSDKVCIVRIEKTRLFAARRTEWEIGQPENVRVIKMIPTKSSSENEA